jgi:hypothetical protein
MQDAPARDAELGVLRQLELVAARPRARGVVRSQDLVLRAEQD